MAEAETTGKLRVFLSYSRKNSAFVEELAIALETFGFDVRIDKRSIEPGEPWEARLERLLQESDTVVFVISPEFVASERCVWEINKAAGMGKRLMPVIQQFVPETQVPERLRRLNYTYFAGDGHSFAKGLAGLTKALNTDLEWIREHTRIADLAERWRARNRSEALLLRGEDIVTAKRWAAKQQPKDAPKPTLLQTEFIGASEKVEHEQIAQQQKDEIERKDAELARVKAESAAKAAQLEAARAKADQRRQRMQYIVLALVASTAGGGIVGWQTLQNQRVQNEADRRTRDAESRAKLAEEQLSRIRVTAELSAQQKSAERSAPRETVETATVGPSTSSPPSPPSDAGGAGGVQLETISGPAGAPPVSKDAVEMIVTFETGGHATYERLGGKPRWPGGQSGVVIGAGYDLGYVNAAQFKADWSSKLPADAFARLENVIGQRGTAAQSLIEGLGDIAVPWDTAIDVFQNRTLPQFAAQVARSLPNARLLPPDSYGALVSLVYNRGPNFNRDGDRFAEMRSIRAMMERKEFDKIPAEIRSMKRIWPDVPSLQSRREAEALLFAKGLDATGGAPITVR